MAPATEDFGGDFVGLIALGCFFTGFSTFLCHTPCGGGGGDHAQTSLKTVTLLSLATLMAVPIYADDVNSYYYLDYILYSANVLVVFHLFYLRFIQKDSVLNKTYDKKLDSFPHWLLCFLPAVGVSVCLCMFLEYPPPPLESGDGSSGHFSRCKNDYTSNVKYCTFLSLQTLSSTLYMVAFIPQVYVVFKVWAGHAHESAGFERQVYSKVKIFLALMFASFCLRSLWWFFWGAFQTDIFIVFFSANAVAAIVTTIPWLTRATFMQCFRCTTCSCCIAKPLRDDPGADANVRVNTGQSNDINALEEAEEEKKKKRSLNENDLPPEEERNVGVIMPEGVSNGTSSPSMTGRQQPTSSFAGGSSSINSYNTNTAMSPTSVGTPPPGGPSVATSSSYYSGAGSSNSPPAAAGGGDNRPDWLRED